MLRIVEWSSYQSYKDRSPPWIRFHKKLLDNYEFQSMSLAARAILPMLWLLASEDKDPVSGLLRDGYEKIAFRLRISVSDLKAVIAECVKCKFLEEISESNQQVTDSLRDEPKSVTPETETETETETESMSASLNRIPELWCEILYGKAPMVSQITASRKAKIKTRLRECPDLEKWRQYFVKIRGTPFLIGENDKGWKADFDWALKPDSMAKTMEGKYDGTRKSTKSQQLDEVFAGALAKLDQQYVEKPDRELAPPIV